MLGPNYPLIFEGAARMMEERYRVYSDYLDSAKNFDSVNHKLPEVHDRSWKDPITSAKYNQENDAS